MQVLILKDLIVSRIVVEIRCFGRTSMAASGLAFVLTEKDRRTAQTPPCATFALAGV